MPADPQSSGWRTGYEISSARVLVESEGCRGSGRPGGVEALRSPLGAAPHGRRSPIAFWAADTMSWRPVDAAASASARSDADPASFTPR